MTKVDRPACQSSSTSGGPHLWSPTVVSMKVRYTFFTSSKCQLFRPIALPLESLLCCLGPTTWSANEYFSKSPIFTASWLSTLMSLLDSFIIFNLHCSRRPSTSTCTVLSPARLLVRHDLESTREMLARTLRRSVGLVFQLYWPPHEAHHQLHWFFPCLVETHQMQSSIGSRPSTGGMIRLKKPALFCKICCTVRFR